MRNFILGLAMAAVVLGPTVLAMAGTPGDEGKAQQIAANLKQSGELKDYRVGVKYQDGVAWLTGTVTSNQQRQSAEQIARGSAGVLHVVNKLAVKASAESTAEVNIPVLASDSRERVKAPRRLARQLPEPQRRPDRTAGQSPRNNRPLPYAQAGPRIQPVGYAGQGQFSPQGGMPGRGMGPVPTGHVPGAVGQSVSYDNPQVPGYAWPSYAASPNYAALTYPKQYSPSAWPYIGPFYPYPQVPLGWRKVTLEWDDGWWFLDFKDQRH